MGVVPIHLGYYNRLRGAGFEAGDAFEKMRERFPTAPRPQEVVMYATVLGDAYLAARDGEAYMPTEPLYLKVARELADQGALEETHRGIFEVTEEGLKVGRLCAQERKEREDFYDEPLEVFSVRQIVVCGLVMIVIGVLIGRFFL